MITVKDLMNQELYTLKPTDNLHQANCLMKEKYISHIPIVDSHGKFVGLLTKHDVLALTVSKLADIDDKEREEIESNIPIGEVMIIDVEIANEDTNLLEAARVMLEQHHGCLPVFHGTQLTGILTESDFVKLAIYLMERMDDYQQA